LTWNDLQHLLHSYVLFAISPIVPPFIRANLACSNYKAGIDQLQWRGAYGRKAPFYPPFRTGGVRALFFGPLSLCSSRPGLDEAHKAREKRTVDKYCGKGIPVNDALAMSENEACLFSAAQYAHINVLIGQFVAAHFLLDLAASATRAENVLDVQGKENRSA
jgi:hypothetical protein